MSTSTKVSISCANFWELIFLKDTLAWENFWVRKFSRVKLCVKFFCTFGWCTKIFHLPYIINSIHTQDHNIAEQEERLWMDHWGMEEFVRVCCIWGYYVYRDIWETAVGEELACEREAHNAHDYYAVAVKRRGTTCIIRHLSWKLSRLCSLFLIHVGGTILCTVTLNT